jgi:hypothetical protein
MTAAYLAHAKTGVGVNFEYLFLGLFAAIAGYFLFNLFRYKGLKGALFGGRIVETFGEVRGTKQGPVRVSLKLHSVASPDHPTPDVGLELVARSFASYQMMPIRLRRTEAQELLRLLQRAIDATA